MRVYLKDGERRPDPEPVKTDDRKAVGTGLILWVITLVAVVVVAVTTGDAAGNGVIATCAVGIALGLALLGHTERRRRRG